MQATGKCTIPLHGGVCLCCREPIYVPGRFLIFFIINSFSSIILVARLRSSMDRVTDFESGGCAFDPRRRRYFYFTTPLLGLACVSTFPIHACSLAAITIGQDFDIKQNRTEHCPNCLRAKIFFEEKNILYEHIALEDNSETIEFVIKINTMVTVVYQ